jgi:hypothetical protein
MTLRPRKLLHLSLKYPKHLEGQETVTITRRVVSSVQVPHIQAEIASANNVLVRLLALRDSTVDSNSVTTKIYRRINCE